MKTDFHCHILPSFDDGPKDVQESIEILKRQKQQGLDRVVSTSHFYRNKETYEQFVIRRQKAYNQLSQSILGNDLPEIILGAEVTFYNSIVDEDISGLCISGTKYLLLELPFYNLSAPEYNLLVEFVESSEYKIIFAHIERYYQFYNRTLFENILKLDALFQVSCDSIIEKTLRKISLKLIKEQRVHIIGTDCHNVTSRPPLYDVASQIIKKKLGQTYLDNLHKKGEGLLLDMPIYDILSDKY